jgi:hypothetical protein
MSSLKIRWTAAACLLALLTTAALTSAQTAAIPKHGPSIFKFNGKDLTQFDTVLETDGLNNDPTHVFTVEHGIIHISGTEMGYIVTKSDYKNYYLRAEFKWGKGTFGSMVGHARDSGILYNIQGPNHVWPRSIEFQISEGATGDFWMTDGAAITGKDGVRVTAPAGTSTELDRFNKSPWKDVVDYRDAVNELEKPHGEWNLVELVNRDGHVWQYVNGKLANEGTDAFPSSGKILLESEGAEIYFRDFAIYPLK